MMPERPSAPRFFLTLCASAVAILGLLSPVYAQTPSAAAQPNAEMLEVNRLIGAKQYDQAVQKMDAIISANPRDAQTRFTRGVVLSAQGKTADAITAFSRMTEDFPELPEPFNNLAVLYAAQSQYEKARVALEMAIRTQPSYATAYDNLGDVYSRLAGQAYEKALSLDEKNEAARTKLTMLSNLNTLPIGSRQVPKTAVASAAPAPTPAPVLASTPTPVARPTAPSVASVPPPESKPVAAAQETRSEAEAEVLRAVQEWANAWSSKNISAYIGAYDKSFDTPRGVSRKDWEAERRLRITEKSKIYLNIENPIIKLQGETASVRFRQVYRADQVNSVTTKTLLLRKNGTHWHITAERAGG